eukprot:scpid82934/ scgid29908/ 
MNRYGMFKSKKAFEALTNPSLQLDSRRILHQMKINDFKVATHTVVSKQVYWAINPFVELSPEQFNRETQLDKVTVQLNDDFDDLPGTLANKFPEEMDVTEARVAVTVERAVEVMDHLKAVPVENSSHKKRVDRYLAELEKECSAPQPSASKILNVFRILVVVWEHLMLATSQGRDMWRSDLMKVYHEFFLPAFVFDFADEKTVSEVFIVISTPTGYNTQRNAADETALLLSPTVDVSAAPFDLEGSLETTKPRMVGVLPITNPIAYYQLQRVDKEAISKVCNKKVNSKGMPYVFLR